MAGYKKLTEKQVREVESEVKMMLHASRDCLRNQGVDTTSVPFDTNDGYYGEAFGILRGLMILGYGYFGSDTVQDKVDPYRNLKFWFSELVSQVLNEENFRSTHECDHCLEKYGKDNVRKKNVRKKNEDLQTSAAI
jgi:hypothetical protein